MAVQHFATFLFNSICLFFPPRSWEKNLESLICHCNNRQHLTQLMASTLLLSARVNLILGYESERNGWTEKLVDLFKPGVSNFNPRKERNSYLTQTINLSHSLELRSCTICINRVKHITFLGLNMHPLTTAQLVSFKLYNAFFQSKKGVVFSHAYIISWMETGTPLTNNNVSRYHPLPVTRKKKQNKTEFWVF